MSVKSPKNRIGNSTEKKVTKTMREGIEIEKKTKTKTDTIQLDKNPDVIVDFEYDEGMLFIIIENIGDDSAYDTMVKFNKKILGIQKTRNISSLEVFQSLKFLPPGKRIRIFVDSFQSYLKGKQPMKIGIRIVFRNKIKKTFQNLIQHDLSVYKDFVDIYQIKKIT